MSTRVIHLKIDGSAGKLYLDSSILGSGTDKDPFRSKETQLGWGFWADDESSTQTYSSTPTKLTINSLGGTTDENNLPLEIRGQGTLWDDSTNKITPIASGDTYSMRIGLNTTSLVSNPTRIDCILDIGGQATPTIEIARAGYTLKNQNEQPIMFSFPIFCLSTFLANGGQIFFEVNSGTVTVDKRNIFLKRTYAGNN